MAIEHFRNDGLSMALPMVMAVGIVVAACASPQEIASADDRKCQADGLKTETSEYNRCRAALETARQQQNVVQAMKQQQEMMQRDAQSIVRMGR